MKGWSVLGSLMDLDEDILQAQSGDCVLDIGWYPAGDTKGKFLCQVIVRGDWDAPYETLETRDIGLVVEWLERWMREAPQII